MEEIRDYFESEHNDSDIEMASQNINEENQGGNNDEISENNINEIESEAEDNSDNNNNLLFNYNNNEFVKENILNFLLMNDILKNHPICEKCDKPMKLVKNKNNIDGKIWRCRTKGEDKHDIKLNIRNGSVFENIKTDIRLLYFILFYNFVENKSIKETYNNYKEFAKQLNIIKITKRQISKLYNAIRIKDKNKMHKMWNNKKLGFEPTDLGKSYCEIDESKIINYNNETRWMFGIYDRGTKETRIFYVR